MKVELTVDSYEDTTINTRRGHRDCTVKLSGIVCVPEVEGCPPGGYTPDGRFPDRYRNVQVSVHLDTNSDGLRALQVGTKVLMELPLFEPDMRPGQLNDEDLAAVKKRDAKPA